MIRYRSSWRARRSPQAADHPTTADGRRFEDVVGEMFGAFGMDLDTEGTENTPRRFVRAMFEATAGDATIGFERIEDAELKGLPGPVALFRVTRTGSPHAPVPS